MTYSIVDNTITVQVAGDVLSTTVESLRQEVAKLLEIPPVRAGGVSKLQLDLKTAKLIDSAGVNLLVGLVRICQSRSLKLGVIVSSRVVHRTLLFTRLDRHMEILSTEPATATPAAATA